MKLGQMASYVTDGLPEPMRAALADAGVDSRSELFAPGGLDIGAEAPEEIALAMIAEIQATFAGAKAESLRQRRAAIHLTRALAVA